MKILLAEDDKNITLILQLVLEKMGGHSVSVVDNGQLALDRATKNRYDLILLDGMMPQMSGLDVLRALSKYDPDHPPVIYLSAKTDEKDLQELKAMGAGHIQKPFDPQEINQKINEILVTIDRQAS